MVGLQDGDHACILYSTEAEHEAVVGTFLAHGLAANRRVLNILNDHTSEQMRDLLGRKGVDVAACEATGQLTFRKARDAYLPDGVFDPDQMVAGLMEAVAESARQGWNGMCGSGEMGWVLQGAPGSERAMEYEAALNRVIPGSRFRAICQYDMRTIPPELLLSVLTTHPVAFLGTKRLDNFYYMPPEEYLAKDRAQRQLARWCRNLQERQTQEEVRQARHRQEQAAERQRAEIEARTRILNAAAHELATPLTPFGLQVRILRSAPDTANLGDYRRNLDVLDRGYQRFADIVHRLVAAVQYGASNEVSEVDVGELLAGLVGQRAAEAKSRGLELRASIAARPRVRTDLGALRRAIDELLLDLFAACPPGCAIQVAADEDAGSCRIVLQQTQNQSGLEQVETAPANDGTTSGTSSGGAADVGWTELGLGLQIAQDLLMPIGGSIRVLPDVRGYRVEVRMPVSGTDIATRAE